MEDSQKRCDATKTKLIEAAGEVFAERGFQSTTIREICSLAGTHVGAVNYHFRDKEGLYAAVIEYSHRLSERVYPLDRGVDASSPVQDRLRAFIRSILLRMLSDGLPTWHGKLMAQEVANPTEAINQMMRSFIRPEYLYLSGILSEMLYGVPLKDETVDRLTFLCAMGVFGQCINFFISRHFIEHVKPDDFDKKDIMGIAEHITRFTIAGIDAIRPGAVTAC